MKTLNEKISTIKAFCNEGEGGRDCSTCPLYHFDDSYCYYDEQKCLKYRGCLDIVERNYKVIECYKALAESEG